eukprot:scaffold320_cov108-Skeletonema_dohrnii-CCMP3373.AAC.9
MVVVVVTVERWHKRCIYLVELVLFTPSKLWPAMAVILDTWNSLRGFPLFFGVVEGPSFYDTAS